MDDVFAAIVDRAERIEASRPHVYGGDAAVASLRCFRRYQKDATFDLPDSRGVLHWVTKTQMRVQAIVARISVGEGRATMLAIAHEAQCHPTTVSRALLKLQAWGLFAVDVRRGRNGGITIRRPFGAWAAAYIRAARQRLRELAARTKRNVASMFHGEEQGHVHGSVGLQDNDVSDKVTKDATFSPSFAQRVMYERGMLALEDPEGESESIPVDVDKLLGMPEAPEVEVLRTRIDRLMLEAALAGDWKLWTRLRNERWA